LPCLKDIHEDYKKSGKEGKPKKDFGSKVETASTYALNRSTLPVSLELTTFLTPATPKKKRPTKKAITPELPSRSAALPIADAPHTDTKVVGKKFEYRNANLWRKTEKNSSRIGANSSKLSSLESIAAATLQAAAANTQGLERESEARRALEHKYNVLQKEQNAQKKEYNGLKKEHNGLKQDYNHLEDRVEDIEEDGQGTREMLEQVYKNVNAEFDALYASQGMERPANSPMRNQLKVPPMSVEKQQELPDLEPFGENYGSDDDSEFD